MQADARETPVTRFTGRLWKVNAGTRASIYDEVITVKGKKKNKNISGKMCQAS